MMYCTAPRSSMSKSLERQQKRQNGGKMELGNFMVSAEDKIIDVMDVINTNGRRVAFVCEEFKLKGVVTDGDIRRYILRNGDLKEKVETIANFAPKYFLRDDNIDRAAFMRVHEIDAMPVIDHDHNLLSIQFLYSGTVRKKAKLRIPVVIMAGGKGSRLYPYTRIIPKPLIPIGDRTVIERIMDNFGEAGCRDYHIIINYKKEFIKAYFMDRDQEERKNISFIEEPEYYGTGGGLKLLQGKFSGTFFMSNCDILVQEDYANILKYHKRQRNLITMVSAMKKITVPYGTIHISDEGKVTGLTEKPDFSIMTNTGLYVIEPEFLDRIPEKTFIHITDIIQSCIDAGEKVGVYPISENAWMDMGQLSEMEKMREHFAGSEEDDR